MYQVHFTDELYSQAKRGAEIEGFATVEAFIAHAVAQRVREDEAETPSWMLVELDKGIASFEAGHKHALEETNERLQQRRGEWLNNLP